MRFILVDRICELEPGVRIIASKTLSPDTDLFEDHFPGFPVVPGVMLTEMMAQASGKCLNASGSRPGLAMLAKIHSAAFRQWVRPGEEVMIHAHITQDRPAFAAADCRAEVAGCVVATAELFFAFAPREFFAPDYRDEILEAYFREHAVPHDD